MTDETQRPCTICHRMRKHHVGMSHDFQGHPDGDYTEYLISQAGGDGDRASIILHMWGASGEVKTEVVKFTNVPMTRVHAAIAVLNGDAEFGTIERGNITAAAPGEFEKYGDTLADLVERHGKTVAKMMYSAMYGRNREATQEVTDEIKFPEPLEKGHIRTEDFTLTELFPDRAYRVKENVVVCQECGATISDRAKHVSWHNKTLP